VSEAVTKYGILFYCYYHHLWAVQTAVLKNAIYRAGQESRISGDEFMQERGPKKFRKQWPRRTERNHEKHTSERSVTRPRLEQKISGIETTKCTATPTGSVL
jgi:hypothetical protein